MLHIASPGRLGIVLAVYDPGQGSTPPGKATEGLHTVMDWTAGIAISIVVICAIGVGVQLGASYFGHGQPRLAGLMYVGAGAIIVTSAAKIVGGLT